MSFFLEKDPDCPPFIALRIVPTENNGLSDFPNYTAEQPEYDKYEDEDKYKGLIVLEVADAESTREKLSDIEDKVDILSPFIGKGCSSENELDIDIAKMYAHAIIKAKKDEEKEKDRKITTRASNRRKSRGTGDDKVVLVWPFEINLEERELIAKRAGEKVFEAGTVAEGGFTSMDVDDEESVVEDKSDGEYDANNVTADTSASNGNTSVNTSVDSNGSDSVNFDIFETDGDGDGDNDNDDDAKTQYPSPPPPGGGGVKQPSKDR